MPARDDCDHCPYREDPGTPCAAVLEGSPQWCHATNPARAIWTPDAVDRLRRRTLESLGRPVPADFPPLVTQAKTLAKAAGRFIASGGRTTTPEEQERRLSICGECPEMVGSRCRRCGCHLMMKIKSAAEHCPIQRW